MQDENTGAKKKTHERAREINESNSHAKRKTLKQSMLSYFAKPMNLKHETRIRTGSASHRSIQIQCIPQNHPQKDGFPKSFTEREVSETRKIDASTVKPRNLRAEIFLVTVWPILSNPR